MARRSIPVGIVIVGLVILLLGPVTVLAQNAPDDGATSSSMLAPPQPVVRAVLFWMPGCGHCHEVITNVLPPLQAQYGQQVEIKLLDISDSKSMKLFYAAAQALGIKPDEAGVPFLVIGDRALLGSRQIPQMLPTLIEAYLAAGGVDWPMAGGIAQALQPAEDAPLVAASAASPKGGLATGFALAVVVMIGVVGALAYSGVTLTRTGSGPRPAPRLCGLVPVLSIIGLGVAGYLAYVEIQAVPAVCGPVGDCNAVQSSPYARLFGVLPIGLLGMLGYLGILAVWLYGRLRSDRLAAFAPYAVFAMTLFGALFSFYLTFLELVVIKAVCAWCLASAVIMALLLVIVTHTVRPWPSASPVQLSRPARSKDAGQRGS